MKIHIFTDNNGNKHSFKSTDPEIKKTVTLGGVTMTIAEAKVKGLVK